MEESKAEILVVEDNRINQMVARQVLKRIGLGTDIANNAREALELLNRHRYRLVLMDLQMPGMDGIAATRVIRDTGSDVLDHEVPIIAMTAYTTAEDRLSCIEAGMNGYLAKPLEIDRFIELVQYHLQ